MSFFFLHLVYLAKAEKHVEGQLLFVIADGAIGTVLVPML